MTIYGVHTNAQGKSIEDLIEVWQHADRLGYEWISISDHFPGAEKPTSNEAVASHTALAMTTTRATCAVMCYGIGFRHPAVLATAAVTIDHLSKGRCAIGIGSGSVARDFEIFGFPYPPAGVRTDMLDEAARCITGLLRDEIVDFAGRHYQLSGATNQPGPVQARLPVWLAVNGRRGLRIAAELADGWNGNFLSVEDFSTKRDRLKADCDDLSRPHEEIATSVNLPLLLGTDPSSLPEERRKTFLLGTIDEVVDRVGTYVDAGADQINFFLPHPWNMDGIEQLAAALSLQKS